MHLFSILTVTLVVLAAHFVHSAPIISDASDERSAFVNEQNRWADDEPNLSKRKLPNEGILIGRRAFPGEGILFGKRDYSDEDMIFGRHHYPMEGILLGKRVHPLDGNLPGKRKFRL